MKTKRILSLLMTGALLTGALTGCGGKKDDSAQSGDSSGVITINYLTFQCGTNTSAPVCDELIKEFNEKYAGKYEIKKEDVPGDQNYIDKIKVQLGTGDLPPVIYGGGYNLLDMVVAKDLAVDLKDKYTIIMVTHNMQQAARISDNTAFFLLGEVVEFDNTEKLFANPSDKRTEDYITGRFG